MPIVQSPLDAILADILPQFKSQMSSILGTQVDLVVTTFIPSSGQVNAGCTMPPAQAVKVLKVATEQYEKAMQQGPSYGSPLILPGA